MRGCPGRRLVEIVAPLFAPRAPLASLGTWIGRVTLSALIAFEEPLEELRAALAAFHRGSDPIITLFTCGEIDGRTLEAWADAIEFREDIQLESGA
ncbi:hypothetical protein BMJ29_32660 [Sinorhizobium medicae]|uniref:Uncharacterized protein n=1 Tax=Sinorhizobium medicae TaxID=110321 RepID=A0ABX4TKQ5_9HYPH|nr:hypothetical protein BMJ33_15510 [Sinorhizobium medicae]PLU12244.1 hypothetical protein BMJ29_32660 [Sinorhizobium medicae]PLU78033.1 hypothetical protein BMJ19_21015 [Sinorhizobium medicae]